MIVYRIENDKHIGPYIGSNFNSKLISELLRNNGNYRPSPPLIYFENKNNVCGFLSIRLYKQWFDKMFDLLQENMFFLKTFDVQDNGVVYVDKYQVVFDRAKSFFIQQEFPTTAQGIE